MPFVKLDCGILNSTVWEDPDARIVFLTALLMAEPREFEEPIAQIEVRKLDPTGWSAPAGWYGFVPAAGTGIARRANVDNERALSALERLGASDPESRSPEFDGRRLIRVSGGYIVLNYDKYRERDYTAAERSRRYRQRHEPSRRDGRDVTRDGCDATRNVTQVEAEVEGREQRVEGREQTHSPDASPRPMKKRTLKAPHLFDVESDAYRLADLLLQLIRGRDPKAPGDVQRWAKDVDALLRIDGREPAEVERVIRWAQADAFWSTNILSGKKLRSQFSALIQKSNIPTLPGAASNNHGRRDDFGEYRAL